MRPSGPSEKKIMAFSVRNTSAQPPVSTAEHLDLGKRGEELAAAYLQQAGFGIVAANFAIPVGRNRAGAVITVEIDLVAYDGETLCFVEVKSRASDWFAPPEVNVDRRKQRQIARAARAYRRMFDLIGAPYRYDVITVVMPAEGTGASGPEIQLLRNYWTEDKFRKRTWSGRFYE
jgi:putative endonuclease